MSKAIIFATEADDEYYRSVLFYYGRSIELANRFEQAVAKSLDNIVQNPKRYPIINGFRRCVVLGFPYCIFYYESDIVIKILAVAHQSRKPNYWQHRVASS
jgi:plasmid stabilization system protein ParE